MHQVIIEGLELYGYHGVFDAERTVGHRLTADIRVTVEGDAPSTDSVEDTVDYTRLAALLHEVSGEESVQTLERLAQRFCDAALAELRAIQEVEIYLRKPSPPMEHLAGSVGVLLNRRRP